MGITDFTLYLYIRSTHDIRGRILHTHNNNGPSPAHRRPAVMARANRCQDAIDPIAPRPCSEVNLLSDQPCSATAFEIASRNAIWRALLGFTGRPRFTTPPFAMARAACSHNRCWRALCGLIGRPVRLPGAVASRCWRLLFGSTGRPN